MQPTLGAALVAELIGTFALVFIGAGTGALGAGGLVGVALAHGLVVVAIAYSFGAISGAHLNPAVTVGVWAAKRMDARRALSYIAFQLVGGALAGVALRLILGGVDTGLGATRLAHGFVPGSAAAISVSPVMGVVIEAILGFFLANTVLQAAIAGRAGNLAPLAIGLTLTFCILMAGPLTGASVNPARSLGPAVGTGDFTDLWVYFVGPPLGGLLAALLFRTVLGDRSRR